MSGFNKKQLNKWMWDRRKKEKEIQAHKKLTYPGLIFQITDTRTDRDLTPSFTSLACNKPLFKVTHNCKLDDYHYSFFWILIYSVNLYKTCSLLMN